MKRKLEVFQNKVVRMDCGCAEHEKSFDGETVLVSGATGFLGKVMVEKLLRSVPGVRHIYVIVRAKKGLAPEERLTKIFDDPLFSVLEKTEPKWRHKVSAVNGDIALPDLGISIEDRSLLASEVSVVIHGAATVRFDEHIRTAYNINVRGTKELVKLAKEMKSLKVFVHISTAYSNCHLSRIEERIHESLIDPKELDEMMENMDDDVLSSITPKLLGNSPNTYAFTKAVAEHVIQDNCSGLPVIIFRPAIVVGTAYEPIVGWTDNVYGPTGLVVGAGTGVIHSLYGDPDTYANVIPVDMCVSCIIVAAAKAIQAGTPPEGSEIPVYNYVSSEDNPLKWMQFKEYIEIHGNPVPPIRAMWCYFIVIHRYWIYHFITTIFLHYLPALLIDAYGKITSSDNPSLFKIYQKIDKFSNVISYFTVRFWKFENDNVKSLWKALPKEDRTAFDFDIAGLNWEKFFYNYIRGLRVYLLKDEMDTVPQATIRWKRFQMAHKILKISLYLLGLQFLWVTIKWFYSLTVA